MDFRAAVFKRTLPPFWMFLFIFVAIAANQVYPWKDLLDLTNKPVGVAVLLAGIGLVGWTIILFRLAGTEVLPSSETNKRLVIKGPYRITRNPMYAGLILVSLGIALIKGSIPFFAVPIALFLVINTCFIPFEEEKMLRQFGSQYADYKNQVRRW